jgi:hypothetical protein
MGILSKAYYHTWNIGFVEADVKDVVSSYDTIVEVHWVKHDYKDRFFADPFILSVDHKEIRVLVEDYPYYDKRGMISMLVIERQTYKLKERKVILRQPFHMSYPFIMRMNDEVLWVAPEASQSGNLYDYTMNPGTMRLENQKVWMNEPLLDSTIMEYEGLFWLFCTKRGDDSNKDLFIYYSEKPEGPWKEHTKNPVVRNPAMARPAGYMVKVGNDVFRVIQKCDKCYGEAVIISKIVKLTTSEFEEVFVKELRAQKDEYSSNFHTLNSLNGITVVDGIKLQFAPMRRIIYEIRNKLKR